MRSRVPSALPWAAVDGRGRVRYGSGRMYASPGPMADDRSVMGWFEGCSMHTDSTPQAGRWFRRKLLLSVLLPLVLLTGCSSMSTTDKFAATGAAAGAGIGYGIGRATGNAAAGTALGTVAGLFGGAVLGNSVEQDQKRQEARTNAAIAAAQAEANRPPV